MFSKRYVAGLEQAAAERKTATRNVEIEGEGGDVSSSAEGKEDDDFYEGEEWEFSDHATRVLFPLHHLFNSLAAVTNALKNHGLSTSQLRRCLLLLGG